MGLLSDAAEFGKDVIDDRDKWANRFKKVGEFIERNAKDDKLERVAKAGRKLADFSKTFTDFFESGLGKRLVKAAKSPILAAGQHVISGMKLTTGVGDPETGERFGQGADRLGVAGQTLTTAFPDDSWDSGGAHAYTGRNSEQVSRAQTMIGADQLVAAVLTREAEQIATTRDNLDSQSDWLGDMSLITLATGCIPYVGKAAQIAAEIAMVTKAVGESTTQLMTMQDNASANAAEVRGAVSRYAMIGDTATPAGDEEEFEATAPAEPDAEKADAPAESEGGVAPSGGGGGGSPGGASPEQSPAMPTGLPVGPPMGMPSNTMAPQQPASIGAGGDVAGVIGGVVGAVMGPLGGLLGGFVQAVGQAAQAATQAATQAAQVASQASGQSQDPATSAADADKAENASTDSDNGKHNKDDDNDRAKEQDRDELEAAEEAAEAQAGDADSGANRAAEDDEEPVKTLPPDLALASADGAGTGRAPVHIDGDFDQGQLRVAAPATLDPVFPDLRPVIDT